MILLGLGAGMAFNPVLLAAMSDVEPTEAGLASGVVNTSFMMGGALGLAVLASLAASRTDTLLADGASEAAALTGGYHVAFFVGALFAIAAAALGGLLLRQGAYAGAHEAPTARRPGSRLTTERRDMDWKLELVAIPVSDVDRAKAFYVEKAGFVADHDHDVSDEIRFVQLTPPGSACSIAIGNGRHRRTSRLGAGDADGRLGHPRRARASSPERGVDVSDVQEFPWGSFVFFSDPDGNRWAVQQLPPRGEEAS